jgi:hypothetical protein
MKADSEWWKGKPVPALLDLERFYFSNNGDWFLLRFEAPLPISDNVWGYHTNKWVKYDGY